jgi:hypothetical protein
VNREEEEFKPVRRLRWLRSRMNRLRAELSIEGFEIVE